MKGTTASSTDSFKSRYEIELHLVAPEAMAVLDAYRRLRDAEAAEAVAAAVTA